MAASPTMLTLRMLRESGWIAEVVEFWQPYARKRKDFLGFIDIIALDAEKTVGVQCTSANHHAERREKAKKSKLLQHWLVSEHREFWVVSWAKKPRAGDKRLVWTPRVEVFESSE